MNDLVKQKKLSHTAITRSRIEQTACLPYNFEMKELSDHQNLFCLSHTIVRIKGHRQRHPALLTPQAYPAAFEARDSRTTRQSSNEALPVINLLQ